MSFSIDVVQYFVIESFILFFQKKKLKPTQIKNVPDFSEKILISNMGRKLQSIVHPSNNNFSQIFEIKIITKFISASSNLLFLFQLLVQKRLKLLLDSF